MVVHETNVVEAVVGSQAEILREILVSQPNHQKLCQDVQHHQEAIVQQVEQQTAPHVVAAHAATVRTRPTPHPPTNHNPRRHTRRGAVR